MNIAQARPRTWTPHIILFSLVLHAVVLYYLAVVFKVVPPILPDESEPPSIAAIRLPPPPPPVVPDEPIKEHPRVVPRQPLMPPVQTQVPPLPYPPQPPAESTAEATVLVLNAPIPEVPVSQVLPRYPIIAEQRGIEGRVVLSITILPDGSVRDVRVVSAAPRGYFEDAAVRAVQRWRYRASNVTRTNVIVHMDFELRDA